MSIITDKEVTKVSLPFPLFQPNTFILSEQVNDNNDELQYKTNLLIDVLNQNIQENIVLETSLTDFKAVYDTFENLTNANFIEVNENAENNKDTLNTRITTEVGTLNNTINIKENTLNGRISTEVNTLNNTINTKDSENKTEISLLKTGKADCMELKNTLLYLKSGATTLSVADLAGLGGGVGRSATNVAFGQTVQVSDWELDVTTGMYKVRLEHSLTTSTPLVVYYDETTGFNMFDVSKVIDSNNVDVYNEVAINTYISVINGSANIELVQAILDDENVTSLRTWSSEKIQAELDKKSTNAISTSFDNSTNGMTATNVQEAIEENKTSILSLQQELNSNKILLLEKCNNFIV